MTYKISAIANIFPLMSADEYKSLLDDIRTHGQLEPIWIFNNEIIDGRNRYKACLELGLEPKVQKWNGTGSLVNFIISLNLQRRHLTSSQKISVGMNISKELQKEYDRKNTEFITTISDDSVETRLKKYFGIKENDFDWEHAQWAKSIAGKIAGIGRDIINTGFVLEKKAPELLEELRNNTLSIVEAKEILKKPESERRELINSVKAINKDSKYGRIKEVLKTQRRERQLKRQATALATINEDTTFWTITDEQKVIKCDAVVCDPPYGILNEAWDKVKLEPFTKEWASRWNKCQADFFLIFWSQRYLFDARPWFDETLTNYKFQQVLIWHYANNKSPQSRKGFKQTYEPIFFYRKNDSSKEVRLSGTEWENGLNDFDCHVAAVPQTNFNDEDMKRHPAQKPVKVFSWLINAISEPNELICDPFCGSGTSGIAAVQLSRRYHGIEIDDEYIKIAKERIATYGIPKLL